ncbi:hypothetical protein PENTCL1PPCAC_6243, partial [Pristionchus entomophagus]
LTCTGDLVLIAVDVIGAVSLLPLVVVDSRSVVACDRTRFDESTTEFSESEFESIRTRDVVGGWVDLKTSILPVAFPLERRVVLALNRVVASSFGEVMEHRLSIAKLFFENPPRTSIFSIIRAFELPKCLIYSIIHHYVLSIMRLAAFALKSI